MKRIVAVVPKDGLHTRPTSRFAETANSFDADTQLGRADEDDLIPTVSMLAVTGLGVGHGEEIRLIADGDDTKATLGAPGAVLSAPEAGGEG